MRKAILLIVLTLTAALFFAACERTEEVRSANVAQATSPPAPQPQPSATTPQPVSPAGTNSAATPQQSPTGLPTPPNAPPGAVRRISTEEARAAFERGQAVFVDVRLDEQYRQGHLPGAILIPLEEVAQHSGKLPRNKLIITYCA